MPCVIAWRFCFNKNEKIEQNTVNKGIYEIHAINLKRKK